MQADRLAAEKAVLAQKLPSNIYVFREMNTSNAHLLVAARTNQGNIYTLKIMLNDFPNSVPKVFVNKMLCTKDGSPMDGVSACMHTLGSENNCTRICHYGHGSWTPMVSLYKVYVKARLWLEMYELHLKTGNDIDYYLNHQS